MQVSSDPVAVLDDRETLAFPAALGELERDGRLRRETGQVGRDQRRRALGPERDEHALPWPVVRSERHGRPGQPVGGDVLRLPRRQDLSQRTGQLAQQLGRFAAADRLDVEVIALREHHEGDIGLQEVTGPVHNQRDDVLALGTGQQRGGDFAAGLHPGTSTPALVVQARVLDRDAGSHGEGDDHALVFVGEPLTATLLGEVEVAEDRLADPDRDAQEGVHRGMASREPGRRAMHGEVGQPQRVRVTDELAQDAVAGRRRPDGGNGRVVDADGDELRQPLTTFVDHAQCAVRRVHQADRDLDDATQHHLQVQVGADREDRVQQMADARAGVGDVGVDAVLRR